MTILRLQNIYSWLNTDNQEIKDLLWKSLRFLQKGHYMNPLFKQKKWSGHVDFFKRETGRFLTGLLPEVKLALDFKKIDYKIIDERNTFPFAIRNVDDQFMNQWLKSGQNPITLHDYQVDYINQITKLHRGIIKSSTGSGKSFIMIGAMKCLPPKTPTLVMTTSVDLCHQLYGDLEQWGFENLGKCIGSKKADFCPNFITVANAASLHKIESLLPNFKVLLVDEVHDTMHKTSKEAYKRMHKASVRIAFSATPFKFGETDKCQKYEVKGFFGPVINFSGGTLTTKDLQDREILSSSKCIFYPIDEPSLPYETYQDAVTLGIAENLHFNKIVAKLAKKLKGRTLIIVDRVAHGEMLNTLIKGSHWVYGEDSTEARQEVIKHLQKSKKCICIVQQKLISAGINVFIHNLINAFSTEASHNVIQRMGRGLRKADDKEGLTYYDWIFNMNHYLLKHSKHRIKVLQKEGHEVIIKNEIDF